MIKKIVLLLCLVSAVSGYKILIHNPTTSYSHVQYLILISDILTDAGHDVTVLMPLVDPVLKIIRPKKAKLIILDTGANSSEVAEGRKMLDDQIWLENSNSPFTIFSILEKFSHVLQKNCRSLMNQTDLLDTLRAEQFDIGLLETFQACGFGLLKSVGVKSIIGGSATVLSDAYYSNHGLDFPSYVPCLMGGDKIPLTLFERAKNLLFHYATIYYFSNKMTQSVQVVFNEMENNEIDLQDLQRNTAFDLINNNVLLDYPSPTTTKIVSVGGIAIKPHKPLPKEYDEILNLRSTNVLVSFGSIVNTTTMPLKYKMGLMRSFAQNPDVTFIFKYSENDIEYANEHKNVIFQKWVAQSDLLGDKRLNLFITHGGLNSVNEMALHGVPSISIPFFSDQTRNSNMLLRLNVTTIVNKKQILDEDFLGTTIQRMLTDKSYKENSMKLAQMIKKYPDFSKEKLIKIVEFACEFGNVNHLDLPSKNMTFIEVNNLDILIIAILTLLAACFVTFKFIRLISRLFDSRISNDKKTN
uniref:Glucuronosyltransferase n=1 Tax=Rhabditophanes sp. KR3021 TaxID=114890 RepID=A0AC35UAG1_9BILA